MPAPNQDSQETPAKLFRIAIISDIHYAAAGERAACANFYLRHRIRHAGARIAAKLFNRLIWLHEIGGHNHQLDRFLTAVGAADLVVANGDYSCNIAQVGLSDPAAFASAEECLGKLRVRFGEKFRATLGDHDLGKTGLFTGTGSMTLASWRAATEDLGIEPFWRVQFGRNILVGITSSLVALPILKTEVLAGEAEAWERLRESHLEKIRDAFAGLKSGERLILFCHDPSALPYLWREKVVREKISYLEQTVIGHLHTNLVLRAGRVLAGFPTISFLGKGTKRISTALGEAKLWKLFRVRLCPAPMGVQLLKDGGWLSAELDAKGSARFEFHPLKWQSKKRGPTSNRSPGGSHSTSRTS